ncbi:hypothetical protein ASPZODRAFT_134571 [Penicilliopsis zonata CBS 506.65]|uniref:Uncharacterized protein n=1 Tax=Penicilliopsis zonata CBS 506.65 TaxID=1073090 RepID=A0A1L9SDH9_9EURO|nr:hypothetical protein ASPZODRAFT_134571 [Penicilliopsis zonata CBS 506.65]OJJ45163.1 hypothetical protein ASPZODRAFT_134571 [Penicilliopsis zonata CBS 506.65]
MEKQIRPHGQPDGGKERKRMQNRLNQRARRVRLKQLDPGAGRSRRPPFRVHRWRLDEQEESVISNDPRRPGGVSGGQDRDSSLPADHQLLHLIQFNTCRALWSIKILLARLTVSLMSCAGQTVPIDTYDVFPAFAVTFSQLPARLGCLAPTPLQTDCFHSTWMNLFPFPRMRDNLITWQACFDHVELVTDLIGNLINTTLFYAGPSGTIPAVAARLVVSKAEDDEITASRTGLIVWGEPHLAESWEATPGFLRKWAWVMAGCDELIESTNRWRRTRGEEPVQVSTLA